MAGPRRYNTVKSFNDICGELDYDPGEELISRRNELSDMAASYDELAEEAAASDDPNELAMVPEYIAKAEEMKKAVEVLDLKMMPYVYARKATHAVTDGDGNSLLEAFASAVKNNIPSPKNEPKQRPLKH